MQTPIDHCDVLVLDARYRQALVATRSLGKRGLRVAAMDGYADAATFSSRWCSRKFVNPANEGTYEYLEYLLDVLRVTQARIVIPSSDGTIAMLRQYRATVEQHAKIAMADEAALAIAVNKERTLEVADRLGILVPRSVHITESADLGYALNEIGLPAVVKPVESWFANDQQATRSGPRLVATASEARACVERFLELGATVLFQQFIPGKRESIYLFYAGGEIYARFAFWVKHAYPLLGGTAVLRKSIDLPADLADQAEQLLRAINLEGFALIEFRRDRNGKPYLMEINPRLSASLELGVYAGIDFPYLLYQWALGLPLEHARGYRSGLWMRQIREDIAVVVNSLTQRGRPGVAPPLHALADFCAAFFVRTHYDYVDFSDPLPFWCATRGVLRAFPGDMKNFVLHSREAVHV